MIGFLIAGNNYSPEVWVVVVVVIPLSGRVGGGNNSPEVGWVVVVIPL